MTNVFDIEFDVTTKYRYGRENNMREIEYQARLSQTPGCVIALTEIDGADDDAVVNGYRRLVLRVIRDETERGIEVTISGPRLAYNKIEWARVNWCAIGAVDRELAAASAEAMLLASEIATAWDAKDSTRLEEGLAQALAEIEEQRALRKKRADQLAAWCKQFDGKAVRILTKSRKTPYVGVATANNVTLEITTITGPERLWLEQCVAIEVKQLNGRFGMKQFVPTPE